MSGSTILIRDPIGKPKARELKKLADRPEDLRGLTVGLLCNSPWSFDVVMQRFKELLKERCGAGDVIFMKEGGLGKSGKATAGRADPSVIEELASKCNVVINGLGI